MKRKQRKSLPNPALPLGNTVPAVQFKTLAVPCMFVCFLIHSVFEYFIKHSLWCLKYYLKAGSQQQGSGYRNSFLKCLLDSPCSSCPCTN